MTEPLTPWEQLRAPFPTEKIGKLPRSTKKDNPKGKCDECGGWHGLPAVHLDYIGHADTTDRLLQVDPEWNWEPLAFDSEGFPAFSRDHEGNAVGLWIKLTVCRVTRLGYGSVDSGAYDAEKQLIGDAIRNAAMRFGVALDLWRKDAPPESEPVPPAVDYGLCPMCGEGKIVRKERKGGGAMAHCSTQKYDFKTKKTSGCPWVDWEPNFELYEQRAIAEDTSIPPASAEAESGRRDSGEFKLGDPCPYCLEKGVQSRFAGSRTAMRCSGADKHSPPPQGATEARSEALVAAGDIDPSEIPFAFPVSRRERESFKETSWALRL